MLSDSETFLPFFEKTIRLRWLLEKNFTLRDEWNTKEVKFKVKINFKLLYISFLSIIYNFIII